MTDKKEYKPTPLRTRAAFKPSRGVRAGIRLDEEDGRLVIRYPDGTLKRESPPDE